MKIKVIILSFATIGLLITSCGGTKKTIATTTPKKQTTIKAPNSNLSYHERKENYIDQYAEISMDEMRVYKVPASITLAQGILESGSGGSDLSRRSNNHFGVKCHKNWTGEKVYHDDDKKGECFRKYKHPRSSFRDHSIFLSTRSRYASLFDLKPHDYKGWAKGLRKAGYATDPKYPQKLITIIEEHKLYNYDKQVLGKRVKEEEEIIIVEEDDKEKIVIDNVKKVVEVAEKIAEKKKTITKTPTKKSVSGKTHVVTKGDTLYNISRKYNLTVDQLKKLNKLPDNNIGLGQELIVK